MKNTTYSYILFLALLLSGASLFAQDNYSFKQLGYSEETTIAGHKAEREFYFKFEDNEEYILNDSKIHLEFERSQILNGDKSHITISINETPVQTKFLGQSNKITFDIPIKKKYVVSGYIRLSIKTNLVSNDVICENYFNDGYWVKLNAQSYLELTLKEKSASDLIVKDISSMIPKLEYLVLPNTLDIKEMEYASAIKFHINRIYNIDLKVATIANFEADSLENGLILSPFIKLRPEVKSVVPTKLSDSLGYLAIYNKEIEIDNEIKVQQNLIVTGKNAEGFKKGAHFLLYKHLVNSAYSNFIIVNTLPELLTTNNWKEFEPIYFKDLNAENRMQKGVGSMPVNISLSRSVFGSSVKRMMVKLVGKYRPLDTGESAFFNLYFNDQLLNAYKLNDSGILDIEFEFEDLVMRKENNFKYEYYHLPSGGICNTNSADFYGHVENNKSYFKPISYESSTSLVFSKFPENFQSKPISIYTDLDPSGKHNLVNAFAELFDVLNPGESDFSSFVYPIFQKASGELIKKDTQYSKIIISTDKNESSSYFKREPYIKFNRKETIYRTKKIQPFINLTYSDDLGFNQLFYYKKSPTMLINIEKSKGASTTLYSLISAIREQTNTNSGNVIISKDKKWYFYDLRGINAEKTSDIDQNSYKELWQKYGLFTCIIFGLLIVLFLIYIYRKSQQSKNKIKNV